MDSRCRRIALWAAGCLVAALVLGWSSQLPAPIVKSQGVKLCITGIKGSKEGEEFVDEKLGEDGQQIKKKYGLKRVEIIAEIETSLNSRWLETQSFGPDMKIKLSVHPVHDNVAWFTVTITRGNDTVIKSDQKIKMNGVGYAVGKMGKDILVLRMVPNLDDSATE